MLSTDSSTASTISIDSDDFNSARSREENDPILPTTEQVQEVFARSRHVWQVYLERAKPMHHISPESRELETFILATSIPSNPR